MLSIVIFALGLIAIPMLPAGEYPEVVPPSVVVRATYPGANPKEIAESVAEPLEEAINGVEGIMYMKSVAGSDGSLQVVVTFLPGVDPDTAAVRVQNRVSQALSRLPDEVRQYGVTTQKQSPTPLMYVSLYSPDNSRDSLYLRNYLTLHVKDELSRLTGIGDVGVYGSGDYAMRLWLDPNRLASRGLTASDVIAPCASRTCRCRPASSGRSRRRRRTISSCRSTCAADCAPSRSSATSCCAPATTGRS